MNNGARRPPAVTGSITIDNSGMTTIENPPPNAPFMKQIRNTPAKVTRTVATVSSMAPPPRLARAWVHRGSEGHHPFVRLAGKWDETVDSRLNLETGQANVSQCAIVEIVKA